MKIFVGNLAMHTAEEDLRQAFLPFGEVTHVNVARHTADGTSRGFAFVDMTVDQDGHAAILKLNDATIHGHLLRVKEAHRKEQ
ncbi:MAG: RNA-binding protein [Candidatus Zixiibacteriota bacterium]